MANRRMGQDAVETAASTDARARTLRRAVALSTETAGEGLRALALAWLGIALGMLAVAPLLGALWWIAALLAALAAAVGLAYWWVVPSPIGGPEAPPDRTVRRLQSTLALSDAATWWTVVGVLIAAAVTAIGVGTAGGPPIARLLLIAGCLIAALAAIRWARSRFVWHDQALDDRSGRATILYNGRFILARLQRLHAEMRMVRELEHPLAEQELSLIRRAVAETGGEGQRDLLKDAFAIHARRSRLMGVHDFSRLPAHDLAQAISTYFQREERVTALWMVPRAWLWMVLSAPFNLTVWLQVRNASVQERIDAWRAVPLEQFRSQAESSWGLLAETLRVLDANWPPATKVEKIEARLDAWLSVSIPAQSAGLESGLDEWFG